jgi:hypothetical protein
MTQGERDRLVALKKAKKKQITQREAAAEQVRRLLQELQHCGAKAVVAMHSHSKRHAVSLSSVPLGGYERPDSADESETSGSVSQTMDGGCSRSAHFVLGYR